MSFTIAGVIRDQAQRRPDKLAIRFAGRDITFAELDRRSSQAAELLGQAGVGPGDRVAFLDRSGPEYFDVLFGGAKLNAVNVAVNWRLLPAEVAGLVADSSARVLVVGPEHGEHAAAAQALVPGLRVIHLGAEFENGLADSPAEDPGLENHPDDIAIQLYTSGTTGLPKGAMISHANLGTLITQVSADWEFDAESINLVASPLFNIAGGGWAVLGMWNGASTILLRDVTPPILLETIERERVTNALFVPALLQFMLMTPGVETTDFSSLRAIVYGASPISEDVLRRSLERFGCHFIGAYALTEAGSVTILRPEEHDLANPARLRSAGRPHAWVEMMIADPSSRAPVPVGEVGEVCVRSGGVMKGYWNRPDDTAATIGADGWLRTGDAGYVDAEGFLYLHDRIKDMVITGGQNVYPAEVENVLLSHPGIADVAVIGVPDERWGETVKAMAVRKPGTEATAEDVIAFARERMAHFKAPTSVDWVDTLPRNPSGKVLKRQLREPFWAGRERQIN